VWSTTAVPACGRKAPASGERQRHQAAEGDDLGGISGGCVACVTGSGAREWAGWAGVAKFSIFDDLMGKNYSECFRWPNAKNRRK
jgi:hypothetical protein